MNSQQAAADVEVEVKHNGPCRIRGPIRVIDADGDEYDLDPKRIGEGERAFVALCRCGGSSTKPFCDGTHKRNGFTAPERAADQARADE